MFSRINLRMFRDFKVNPWVALFLFGFFIHAWNIGADLPNNYNTDEPHHLNKAARFGTGDLNPHDFKYPSLWSYTLALMLGVMYAAGAFVGAVTSPADFAQKYLYHPTSFILGARLLSVFFLSMVPLVFYRIGLRYYSKPVAIVAAFAALISTSLSDFSLQGVPYSMLVFFAACAIYCMHGVFEGEGSVGYLKTGFFIGLSISSHYVAAPFASMLLVAFFNEKGGWEKSRCFALGALAVAVGFLCGTPYALLSLQLLLPDFHEHYQLENVSFYANVNIPKIWNLFLNVFHFMDKWGVGFFLFTIGLIVELRKKNWRALCWLLPLGSAMPILLLSAFGGAWRYTVLLSLPYFLLVASGFLWLYNSCGVGATKKVVLASVVSILFASSYLVNRWYLAIPDTRTLARDWIQKNIPQGEKVLLPGPYFGPQLIMAKTQVERLLEKTKALHHPRVPYFQALLDGHPGGGYELFYVKRTIEEVLDLPSRTEQAFQAQEFVDVPDQGVAALTQEGVRYVVLLANWDQDPRHHDWMMEVRSKLERIAIFEPQNKKVKGNPLEIYRFKDLSVAAPR